MSRSKRTPGQSFPAPGESLPARREKRAWVRQTGWLLAVSLVCYGQIAIGLRLALDALFAALFRAWGVNAATAVRAPHWAQLVWRWHGSLVTVAVAILAILLSRWLRRLWRLDPAPAVNARENAKAAQWWRGLGVGALIGLAAAVALLLAGLIPDSLRMESPPRLTAGFFALLAVSLAAVLSEEAFTKGVLYDGLAGRWGRLWATIAACAVFFVMNGGLAGTVVSGVNVLLLGLLCCAIHERRGLWTAVGLRWGWSAATVLGMGFGGGEASLTRFYGVSEGLLTGGDAGPVYGLYMTAALALGLVWLHRKR